MNRRQLLYGTTAAFAATGVAVAAWPFIAQMNQDAHVRASTDVLDWDVSALREGNQERKKWRGRPISVVRRTTAILAAMQDKTFLSRLLDLDSQRRQQPAYARNWHRSTDPAYAVLVAICTSCGCVPEYVAETSPLARAGDYHCPCCATRYDPAGRVYSGLMRFNLAIPPYDFTKPTLLRIGQNAGGEQYRLESVEAI